MKKTLLYIGGLLCGLTSYSQNDITSFGATGTGAVTTFVTDYQALGINPANLGWTSQFQDKNIAFGFTEVGFSVHSEAFANPVVRQAFRFKTSEEISLDDKVEIVKALANEGIYLNTDVSWVGFGLTTGKLGGFAFSVRDRIQSSFRMNEQAANLLFLGYNADYFEQKFDKDDNPTTTPEDIAYGVSSDPKTLAQLFGNTSIGYYWYREFNLGYGKRILNTDLLSLYAGIGLKYLQGIGVLDIHSDGETLSTFSALSPSFGVNYGDLKASGANYTSDGGSLSSVGKGGAIDLGFNAVILKKLKIGVALNGMGKIVWKGNGLTANNKVVDTLAFGGIDNANIFAETSKLVASGGLFEWEKTENESKTIATPAVMRVGMSYQLAQNWEVGFDVTAPATKNVPGSIPGAIFAIGSSIKPIPWFKFSTGYVTGENYRNKIPVGITFIKGLGTWESGIASRDIVSLFSDHGTTISVVTGFLRFRI